ncbi:hypothetical protein [Bradyrhizobium sp. AZCC 2289]|uniref:hypothetical protein n=1 Tax=Bradyrhizobium sp. AZCC 2289 TaxID=3117026 RepID=UPI002FEF7611
MSPYGWYIAVAMNSTEVLKVSSQTGRGLWTPAFSLVWRPHGRGCVNSGAVMAISAEAELMFASWEIIQRAGTIGISVTGGAMTTFCRLLK